MNKSKALVIATILLRDSNREVFTFREIKEIIKNSRINGGEKDTVELINQLAETDIISKVGNLNAVHTDTLRTNIYIS